MLLLLLPGCLGRRAASGPLVDAGDDDGGGSGGAGATITCVDVAARAPRLPSLWTKLAPDGAGPTARRAHATVYDAADDRAIVYGGRDQSGNALGDVWVLANATGAAPAWTALAPTGTPPAPRFFAMTAYDPAAHALVVYGGASQSGQLLGDLWVLGDADGRSGAPAWRALTPAAGPAPTVRGQAAVAYDAAHARLIIFGGGSCPSATQCNLFNDVWVLANATGAAGPPVWSQVAAAAATAPAPRVRAVAAYDGAGDRLIVMGGNTSTANPSDLSAAAGDTWILSGASGTGGTPAAWTALAATGVAPKLDQHAAAYDPTTDRLIVFGGVGADSYVRNDVWLLEAALTAPAWAAYPIGPPLPAARAQATAVYAPPPINRMTIFGGDTGGGTLAADAWTLRAANGRPATQPAAVVVTAAATGICQGNTVVVTATVTDPNGDPIAGLVMPTWTSDDPSVAIVDDGGTVTGVMPGTTTVRACAGAVCGQIVLTVVRPAPPAAGADSRGGRDGAPPGNSETWSGTFTGTVTDALDCIASGTNANWTLAGTLTIVTSGAPLAAGGGGQTSSITYTATQTLVNGYDPDSCTAISVGYAYRGAAQAMGVAAGGTITVDFSSDGGGTLTGTETPSAQGAVTGGGPPTVGGMPMCDPVVGNPILTGTIAGSSFSGSWKTSGADTIGGFGSSFGAGNFQLTKQ